MHLEICPADKIHTNKGDMRMDAKYLDFIPTGDIYLFNIGAAQKAWLTALMKPMRPFRAAAA